MVLLLLLLLKEERKDGSKEGRKDVLNSSRVSQKERRKFEIEVAICKRLSVEVNDDYL